MRSVIGILSDAHGNDLALNRALALLLSEGAERIYFLGDAIGYIPSIATLDLLSQLGEKVQYILGNHEAMMLKGSQDSSREVFYKHKAIRSLLTKDQLANIASWPTSIREQANGVSMLMLHGSPIDSTFGYVYPDTDLSIFSPNADWIFMGNTHRPFIREYAGRHFVNVGSCGMPRDDGRFGSVALFDTIKLDVRILRFDISEDSRRVLERFSEVHSSVIEVYERRMPFIVGEIL